MVAVLFLILAFLGAAMFFQEISRTEKYFITREGLK